LAASLGFTSSAITLAWGTISAINSSRLDVNSADMMRDVRSRLIKCAELNCWGDFAFQQRVVDMRPLPGAHLLRKSMR